LIYPSNYSSNNLQRSFSLGPVVGKEHPTLFTFVLLPIFHNYILLDFPIYKIFFFGDFFEGFLFEDLVVAKIGEANSPFVFDFGRKLFEQFHKNQKTFTALPIFEVF
jgi:hypothetical protein